MIAVSALNVVNPEVVVPKQVKLLGAVVKGVGLITTVSVANVWRWALIERPDGTESHVFLADLKKDQVAFPAEQQEYVQMTRRVGYGLFADVFQLKTVEFSDLTHVDELERAWQNINRAGPFAGNSGRLRVLVTFLSGRFYPIHLERH